MSKQVEISCDASLDGSGAHSLIRSLNPREGKTVEPFTWQIGRTAEQRAPAYSRLEECVDLVAVDATSLRLVQMKCGGARRERYQQLQNLPRQEPKFTDRVGLTVYRPGATKCRGEEDRTQMHWQDDGARPVGPFPVTATCKCGREYRVRHVVFGWES